MNTVTECRSGRIAFLGILTFTLAITGCSLLQQQPETEPTRLNLPGIVEEGTNTPPTQIAIADMRRSEAIARVEELLRDEGFWIEVIDRRFGRIRTLPAPVPVAGEFWAGPAATGSEQATATLSAMRRIALVEITETPRSAVITIEIRHQRLAASDRRISGSFSRRVFYDTRIDGSFFNEGSTGPGGVATGDPYTDRMMWVPAGRDVGLETRLLDQIKNNATDMKPAT
ncbi:MAG: hypothetical protein RLN76_07465 [Phycisphaeraceae bacterium]